MKTRELEVGDALSESLEVVEVLHGSMSRVLVLKNLDEPKPFSCEFVCAKTPHVSAVDGGYSMQRFRQEAESWIRIGRYYPIVTAYDYREVEGQPYLLMEYADGGSLRDLRQRGFQPNLHRLDCELGISFIFLIAIGMRKFYEVLDLPHGDLRPENVLLGRKGQLPKIADFGIASAFSDSPRARVDHDVAGYGEVLSFLFRPAGRPLGYGSSSSRLKTPPVVEQLIEECALSRGIRDGYAFFDGVADRINDFVVSRSGTPIRTPEEYDREANARRNADLANLMRESLDDGMKVLYHSSEDHENPGLHLNHAGSLSDLGDQEGAFAEWLKGVAAYRSNRDSREFEVAVRIVQRILSRVADPVRQAELQRRAERVLLPPSALQLILELDDPAMLASAYAFGELDAGEIDAANRILIDHMIEHRSVDVIRQMLAASNPDGGDHEILLRRGVGALAPMARQVLPLEDQLELLLLLEDAARATEKDWARRLTSVLLKDRGQLLAEVERFQEAMQAFQASMRLSEALSVNYPEDAIYRHDIAVLLERIGDLDRALGKGGAALSAFRKSLVIREELAEQDPGNVKRQRDLLVIHGRIHAAATEGRDLSAALAAARASLDIAERLAEDSDDVQANRDLSVSQECLATSYLMVRQFAGAVKLLRQAIRIRQRLVDLDAADATRYRDLAVAHLKLSEALWFDDDSRKLGEHHLGQGVAALNRMREQGVMPEPGLVHLVGALDERYRAGWSNATAGEP